LPVLWTNTRTRDGFDWTKLLDPNRATGQARMDAQYWRANINPSDRYVISAPGTCTYRLHSGQSGFDNLVLAGDWTQTALNCGAVEAAVMSGRNAVSALTHRHVPILGPFHERSFLGQIVPGLETIMRFVKSVVRFISTRGADRQWDAV
jgi:flavin-dependent amine oxidoreductase